MKLTFRQIEIFNALMTAESVTSAADMLHTSQPTISRELARLEQVLGFSLFERVRGRLKPSNAAYTLFEEVKRSYIGLERIWSTVEDLRTDQIGRLSVLTLPAFSQSLLPGACLKFLDIHQRVGVSIAVQESPFLEQSLSYQQYDLGLTENNDTPSGTTLKPLLSVDEVCILPNDHPLLAKDIIDIRDFEGQAFINLSPTDPYRIKLDQELYRLGINRKTVIETPTAASVCQLVSKGAGIAIINPLTALDFIDHGLQIRPLNVSYPFTINILLPLHRPFNPHLDDFITALEAEAKEIKTKISQYTHDSR
ncbi:LysR family transcriptional regulator [Marinomonas sp. UCMA 3892]|jgi:DNA-binding transcriptional LysR family regulator|uniref:Transcriptional regulator, LysR family n=1 Tax=Marinomonas sp. (strain MWYL1) TaxID=400668 RepID=A6VWU4_MARMS|nr:LysR family transcriptional regulator [Marinomonas sp. UCMA 3892]NLU99702.1 LysR family transcriptional regulator [Marinomonas sp. UCMA 3892]